MIQNIPIPTIQNISVPTCAHIASISLLVLHLQQTLYIIYAYHKYHNIKIQIDTAETITHISLAEVLYSAVSAM